MDNCYSQFYARRSCWCIWLVSKKNASQIWWNSFSQNPGDLKNLPFKMVADSDGLLVQQTSEHQGLRWFTGVLATLRFWSIWGMFFSQIFYHSRNRRCYIRCVFICGRRKRRCACSDVWFFVHRLDQLVVSWWDVMGISTRLKRNPFVEHRWT